MTARTEYCPPSAVSLVLSLRAMGYELHTAISDLIDNSIVAHARNIRVSWDWDGGKPWVLISDDGKGMTEEELKAAMKPGTKSPNEARDKEDLGRFGLGLKTASWSQCKLMTVMSKTPDGELSHRQWDLDLVEKTDSWSLLVDISPESRDLLTRELDKVKSGTVVLWQKLDRITGIDCSAEEELKDRFNERFSSTVLPHLEMTFHRFLSGKDGISLKVGNAICRPWDPFLSSNPFTEERPTETFDGGSIAVTPFIMPHSSNLTEREADEAEGPWGWSAQQGFYVYRNKRMIISGGYLGLVGDNGRHFEAKDHYRLCRIRVDLPNDVDHEWDLDVRKAQARPPLRLRRDFERLARSTREKSSQIYRRRTIARTVAGESSNQKADIWQRKKVGPKTVYKVNRRSAAVEYIRESANLSRAHLNALLHLIERTVPYRGITVDNNEVSDSTVDLPDDLVKPPAALVALAIEFVNAEINRGKQRSVAVDYVCQVVMPLGSPQLRIALEKEFLDV